MVEGQGRHGEYETRPSGEPKSESIKGDDVSLPGDSRGKWMLGIPYGRIHTPEFGCRRCRRCSNAQQESWYALDDNGRTSIIVLVILGKVG